MKKIITNTSTIKEKICDTCGLQKTCADLSGFFTLAYQVPITLAPTMQR